MNNRRKFIVNSGIATLGLTLIKPFSGFATNSPQHKKYITEPIFEIFSEGNIKIAVFNTIKNGCKNVDDINAISTHLKKEKKYQMVICQSEFGYKNSTGLDDISLAAQSENLDIIVNAHPTNNCKHPYVLHNKKNEEIIISQTFNSGGNNIGNLTFVFDANLNKKSIDFR